MITFMDILSHLRKSKNSFEGIFPDEETLVVLREHWFNILTKMGILAVAGILPFVLYALLTDSLENNGITLLYWLVATVYLMFLWFKLFHEIMKYLMNVWIVTNHRIIDAELHSFFNRSVSELSLSKIQDISIHINGLYQTFLDFGDVMVQSAGEDNKFIIHGVPNPNAAKEIIIKAAKEFETTGHENNKEPLQ